MNGAAAATFPAPAPLMQRRALLVGLGAVDVGPGGAVDHRVGTRGVDRGAHGAGIGDVEVAAGERDDVVPGALGRGDDVTAQHARCPRDEKAHRRVSLARPQRQPELEARLRVLEPLAEQLAQLLDAVADGLRVDAERGSHGLHLARAVEPCARASR